MRRLTPLALAALVLYTVWVVATAAQADPLTTLQADGPTVSPSAGLSALLASKYTGAAVAALPSAQTAGHGAIVCVEVHFANGPSERVPPGCTPVPTPPTPEPTSPTPPTVAPTVPPTNTPHATSTPETEPSPTPEVVIPTVTPGPTIPPKTCTLRAAKGINIRRGPDTGEPVVAPAWALGTERVFTEFANSRDFLWGRHELGWSVIRENGLAQWWVYGSLSAELCADLDTWPVGLEPPGAIARFYAGFHTLAGEGASALLAPQYIGKYKLIKCLDNGWDLCAQAKARDPEVKAVCRTFMHDEVPERYYHDAQGWWDVIKWRIPDGGLCDWIEVENEHQWPIEYAADWAQWSIDMAQIIERERGAALLAFSAGPGNPDLPYWRDLWAYVNWTVGRTAPNGLQHGIATHASVNAPAWMPLPTGSWINNPFISDRENIVCEMAAANHYGVSCDRVLFIWTEAGATDGYQGTKDTFTCEQKGEMYRETIRRKIADGVVDGFAWWSLGRIGIWSDDSGCLPQMLQ